MGESKLVSTARLCAAVTAGLAATALLASCSSLGAAPGTAAPAESVSASTPSASASASPSASEPAPSEDPVVVVTPTTTPAVVDRTAVVPFVTSVLWDAAKERLDVSAIVPEIVETGGTCTVTATMGDATATATATGPAAPAASTTGCSQLAIDGADLAPGEWQVRVAYSSDESAGTSVETPVTVG